MRYVKYSSGTHTVTVAIGEPSNLHEGVEQAGIADVGRAVIVKAERTFEEALTVVKHTADAVLAQFQDLKLKPAKIEVSFGIDVYQAGHHGSYNGTSEEIIAAMVRPEIAVISMSACDD